MNFVKSILTPRGSGKSKPEADDGKLWIDRVEVTSKVLGKGGYGVVLEGLDHSRDKSKVAVKTIRIKTPNAPRVANQPKTMDLAKIEKEVAISQRLTGSPNIIQLLGQELLDDSYYLVYEIATGGELFDKLMTEGTLSEDSARKYFGQMMQAVAFCHSRGVMHRDIKLENVLLDSEDNIKLIDFGLAHAYEQAVSGAVDFHTLYDMCGSRSYACPEMLSGKGYDWGCDVWSCGIVLFALLAGFFAVEDAEPKDLRYRKIVEAQLQDHMLRTEPKQRVQVKDVLLHPWLTSEPHPTEPERYRSAVEEEGEGEEEEDGFSSFGMMAEPEGQEEAPVELVMIRKREAESQLVI